MRHHEDLLKQIHNTNNGCNAFLLLLSARIPMHSTEPLTYFVLADTGHREMQGLAQGQAGVQGRNEDTNNAHV